MNTSLIGALISILLWITVIAKIEICCTEFKGFENGQKDDEEHEEEEEEEEQCRIKQEGFVSLSLRDI
ncbi:MAG: hypothetical protein ACJ70R_07065 [Nitrososphaera sp.]